MEDRPSSSSRPRRSTTEATQARLSSFTQPQQRRRIRDNEIVVDDNPAPPRRVRIENVQQDQARRPLRQARILAEERLRQNIPRRVPRGDRAAAAPPPRLNNQANVAQNNQRNINIEARADNNVRERGARRIRGVQQGRIENDQSDNRVVRIARQRQIANNEPVEGRRVAQQVARERLRAMIPRRARRQIAPAPPNNLLIDDIALQRNIQPLDNNIPYDDNDDDGYVNDRALVNQDEGQPEVENIEARAQQRGLVMGRRLENNRGVGKMNAYINTFPFALRPRVRNAIIYGIIIGRTSERQRIQARERRAQLEDREVGDRDEEDDLDDEEDELDDDELTEQSEDDTLTEEEMNGEEQEIVTEEDTTEEEQSNTDEGTDEEQTLTEEDMTDDEF